MSLVSARRLRGNRTLEYRERKPLDDGAVVEEDDGTPLVAADEMIWCVYSTKDIFNDCG
jgi:hypothetical protein